MASLKKCYGYNSTTGELKIFESFRELATWGEHNNKGIDQVVYGYDPEDSTSHQYGECIYGDWHWIGVTIPNGFKAALLLVKE